MEPAEKIPKPTLARLQEHFDHLVPRNLFLVKQNTFPNRVYRIPGSSAVKDDVFVAFKIIKEGEQYICEYLLDARGYTEHRRHNIYTDQTELLENFEGQFGNSEFEDEDIDYEEHKRILKHNTAIRKLLIKKGFLRK